MPFIKYSKIDEIYKNHPEGYKSYEELRRDLMSVNTAISNDSFNNSTNSTSDSYVNSRKLNNDLVGHKKKYSKKTLYGIVVGNTTTPGKNVFVDVPLHNIKLIKDENIFFEDTIDLEEYQEFIFYPRSNSLQFVPAVGSICMVQIPENYPNHIYSNPEDAVFIDVYKKQPMTPIGVSSSAAPVALPGSLASMISSGASIGSSYSMPTDTSGSQSSSTFFEGTSTPFIESKGGAAVNMKSCIPGVKSNWKSIPYPSEYPPGGAAFYIPVMNPPGHFATKFVYGTIISCTQEEDDEAYKRILSGIGAPINDRTMLFCRIWKDVEGSCATYNPFNTTWTGKYYDRGATIYNFAGVKNYSSMEDGIQATINTLKLHYYTSIVDKLRASADLGTIYSDPAFVPWGTHRASLLGLYNSGSKGGKQHIKKLPQGGREIPRPTPQVHRPSKTRLF